MMRMFYVIHREMMFQVQHQEEDDTRNMVHLSDSVIHGLKPVMIRTVDIEVATIAVSLVRDIGADELWLAFWNGESIFDIYIPDLSSAQGIARSHTHTSCVPCLNSL